MGFVETRDGSFISTVEKNSRQRRSKDSTLDVLNARNVWMIYKRCCTLLYVSRSADGTLLLLGSYDAAAACDDGSCNSNSSSSNSNCSSNSDGSSSSGSSSSSSSSSRTVTAIVSPSGGDFNDDAGRAQEG
ncbi:hypothetical protein V1477_005997 [Vespula maculifrons]|uniref:Uncharacterized protein n=1 Tax=Vespula maculifrons TaxID=7453 RepID=A0ABD2CL69_VESMC